MLAKKFHRFWKLHKTYCSEHKAKFEDENLNKTIIYKFQKEFKKHNYANWFYIKLKMPQRFMGMDGMNSDVQMNIPHIHCRPVLCIAESSLRSHIKPMWMWKTYWCRAQPQDPNKRCLWFRDRAMAQRPLIKHQFMCYQARQGSSFISHTVVSGRCTMWIQRQWELIQFGYLGFKMPTGSAVVEVAQVASSSLGTLKPKAARRKLGIWQGNYLKGWKQVWY